MMGAGGDGFRIRAAIDDAVVGQDPVQRNVPGFQRDLLELLNAVADAHADRAAAVVYQPHKIGNYGYNRVPVLKT